MWKIFNILFLCIAVSWPSAGQDKAALMIQVLQTAKDYGQIAPVLDIIRRYDDIYCFVPSLCPVKEKYRVSDYYGYRIHPILKKRMFHDGIDLAAAYASTIHAAADGTVIQAGTVGGYGKTVVIRHKYGFVTRYSHLTYIYCKVGQDVCKGGVIGFIGSTGRSTGNHLHYEVEKNNRKINPLKFL